MRFKSVAAIALCPSLLFASSAFAAGGNYLSGGLGLAFATNADLTEGSASAEAEFDTGFVVQGALGHGYPNGLRAELEVAYRSNDADKIDVRGISYEASGDITSLSVLLNGYYDFRVNPRFTPYVGAGIGFANVSIDSLHGGPVDLGNHDDTVFAYQLSAGLEFPIMPSASIDLMYRFFATSDPKFGSVEAEYRTHNLTAGVRLYF